MKKLIYFCTVILFGMNAMAQFDPDDRNWKVRLDEEFDEGSSYWHWDNFLNYDRSWRAYPGSGVTNRMCYQVYQQEQCQIDTVNNLMKFVCYYDSLGRIQAHDYALPSWMYTHNGGPGYPQDTNLMFFSGDIDYVSRRFTDIGNLQYGYFEIKCKLPVHPGAFCAFWLYDSNSVSETDKFYEEIDIFEYTWNLLRRDTIDKSLSEYYSRIFTTGMYQNKTGDSPPNHITESFSRKHLKIPLYSPDLTNWHTWGCEWLPDHVRWYFDGELVNEYSDVNHIPQHPLILKTNYAIDNCFKNETTIIWHGTDVMTIDYIKVYQLDWDCDTDEIICCQNDLDDFNFAVKKSITITSSTEEVQIGANSNAVFRCADSFEISGPFSVDAGGELTVIIQDCQ